MLMFPAFAFAEQDTYAQNPPSALETISSEDAKYLDDVSGRDKLDDIRDSALPSPYKEPTSKKDIFKKLVVAMLGVAVSSLIIYLGLTVYNKIRDGVVTEEELPPEGDKPLNAPNDLIDAVKSFIERTKWY